MEKGTLVEVKLHGDRRLVVIDRPEGKKHFQAIDENGNTHTIHPREINYTIKASGECPSFNHLQIPSFLQKIEKFLDPSSLEVAWEILIEDNQATSPSDLANLLFSELSAVTSYASYCLLSNDKIYFKQKGELYEPRSLSQVSELKHQAEAAAQRAKLLEEFQQKITDKLAGVDVTWTTSDRSRLDCLERYALHGDEASDKAAAQELLSFAKRSKNEQSAFQMLVDLGIWSEHENLNLLRSQIPIRFANELIAAAQECFTNPIPDKMGDLRRDLTHLHVYTIDDISTTEIDDGLSIETLADGSKRIWIHIADPTRWLDPESALDKDARKRGTSVYLPTGVIPMFPMDLATGPMSLIESKVCHAMSFAVDLDAVGAIANYEIVASLVKPNYRLTYDDVEEMLQLGVEDDLERLADYARLRKKWRVAQGAIEIHLPDTSVKVDSKDGDRLTLELMEDTFSRQLVAEMMILAGEVAAKFAQTNNIPIPYRYQEQPELPPLDTLMQLPSGPVREFAICRCMTKGSLGLYASRHSGLGLDAYAQVTSPIRRYSDLLAHWQIKAFLLGEPLPFTAEMLTAILQAIDPAIWDANQVEKQSVRYWSLEYLRRNKDVVWEALMLDWLRENEKLALVLIEDLGLKLPMRITRQIQVGDNLRIKTGEVDPRKDIIYFQESQQSTSVLEMEMERDSDRHEFEYAT
ncbi:MAG: ribonuclease catalytic domain-containing protein [Pseudanabaena sp.]|nr:VacB/RNase II family 3'-5' exoribonuclease [Pseudanabaena sp. M090S1SP2A07QC]MCA6506561.1 VacB/RNase II family 3'-5' exoribonuclease [Pseudanabaena sp. M172S2SP2A07QC]MCA6508638.1 VacB/RNase II family 3'-5' exoribonuclease [Pseudanabaena sp. M109S1SP2A07QC]MCA6520418.1 VacB/RNase II family 3'-5' exoribonuclease [Pseudanabaena sp. M051S1SP2A07QC]MCA6526227.1 VacB/RNase II family 3'-5' exoribonuclease [Pseudanabaena sp. M179S2SP2A07QC]MCA6530137.1 VacB/RNase II family 3'-5' exoribonuclease [P